MAIIFIVCGFRSLHNTSKLALQGGTDVQNAIMAGPVAACVICKGTVLPGALKYRLWKESTGATGPTELYRHLSPVAGAVPNLCSAFFCLPCRGSVLTASRQKERFKQSRKRIDLKLHRDPPTSAVISLPRLDTSRQKQSLCLISPLARTGVSSLPKRPPSDPTIVKENSMPMRTSPRKLFPIHLRSLAP